MRVRILGAVMCAFVLSLIASAAVNAQSLDEQYEYFLAGKCENMRFQRDSEARLLPGQAGPHLDAFCSGLPIVAGGGNTNSSGGGAGVAGTRGPGAQEDAALRRRRERVRHPDSDAAAAHPADYTLLNTGATGAFFSLDYQHERQKTTFYEAGRNSNQYGGTLGLDHRFGTTALSGLAVRYNYQSGDFANSGGDFLTRTYGASLYGSWFPIANAFVDVTAGLDYKQLDITRIVGRRQVLVFFGGGTLVSYNPELAPVRGDSNSRQPLAEIRVGYDLPIAAFTLGPRAAMTWRHTQVDGFTETGATPMTLAFDEQTDTSLRSALGLQASKAFSNQHGVLVPQLNIDWIHEYRADQHTLTAHFAEDLRPAPAVLRFLNQAPDRDFFVARLSTVAVLKHGFSAFLSVESTAGHQYIDRYTVVLGARAEL
jgi:uncharacterized protein YhjY with autotransporter beta-barrel domain